MERCFTRGAMFAPGSTGWFNTRFQNTVKGDATMRTFTILGLALAIGLTALPERAKAAGSSTEVPVAITVFIPCANNGAGETVTLTGNLHIEFNITFDNAGGGHLH